MKKLLLVALFLVTCAGALPRLSAQSAMFTYTGVPAGPVNPGSSFTIGVNLVFVAGGGLPNLQGFSLWMAQLSPANGFPFSITNLDDSGSLFIHMGPPFLDFPQLLDPINRHPGPPPNQVNSDLGALALAPLPTGTYFLANLTFAVAANALPGNYTIGNTTSSTPMVGGRISIINDSNGNTGPIAASNFNIAVVPEPSSFALMVVAALGTGVAVYGRRRTLA